MRNSLFREEVLQAQHNHYFGDPVFYQPLSVRILMLAATGFILVLVAFSATADIKQTEGVRGYIRAVNGEIRVYPPRTGVVQQLHVNNGDLVTQGQLLASVIEPGYDQHGGAVNRALILHIEQQISWIAEKLLLLEGRRKLLLGQAQVRQMSLQEELRIRSEDHQLSLMQLDMAETDLARLEGLTVGITISDSELAQGMAAVVASRKSYQAAMLVLQSSRRMLQEARHEVEVETARLEDEGLSLLMSLSQLEQRRDELQYQQNFSLTAPFSGRVENLLASTGDQIDPRRPFVSIVADEPDYEALIFVPSRALGRVREGQIAMLNYDAFPYQQYGSYQAVIQSIGTSAIDPREHLIPLDISEPVYLVRAELLEQQDSQMLRPGLQFGALVVTGNRTLLRGIIEPLTSIRARL